MTKPFKIGDIVRGVELLECDEEKSTPKEKWWKYKCPQCGTIKSARSSKVGSLCKKCSSKNNRAKVKTSLVTDDLTGKIFGYWQVLFKSNKSNFWHCKCLNCGTEKDVFRGSLINGDSKSCGCIKSWGETQILYWLKKLNFSFKKEITFSDLIGLGGRPLRFDFGIYNDQKQLLFLIEYDGEQHFTYNKNWNLSQNEFQKLQEHDRMKNQYCLNNNLKLIRITKNDNIEQVLKKIKEEVVIVNY